MLSYYDVSVILTDVTVSFQELTYSVLEGASVSVCGNLSMITETSVVVALTVTSGTAQRNIDFTLSASSLTFQPGETQSCTFVSATVDNTLEEDESFTLELQSTNNLVLISPTAGMTRVTIPNQDSKLNEKKFLVCLLKFLHIAGVMVSFQQPTYLINEGNSVEVCAVVFPEADIEVSVSFTISGGTALLATDFTLSPSTQVFTIEAGAAQSCVTLAAVDDALLEEDEDITLTLQSTDTFVGISSIVGATVITIPNRNSKN